MYDKYVSVWITVHFLIGPSTARWRVAPPCGVPNHIWTEFHGASSPLDETRILWLKQVVYHPLMFFISPRAQLCWIMPTNKYLTLGVIHNLQYQQISFEWHLQMAAILLLKFCKVTSMAACLSVVYGPLSNQSATWKTWNQSERLDSSVVTGVTSNKQSWWNW